MDEKKRKTDEHEEGTIRGTAKIKAEFLADSQLKSTSDQPDDDAAEAAPHIESQNGKKSEKKRGANKNRDWGTSRDAIRLCATRVEYPEFSPRECPFGEKCRDCHDLRKYLAEGKQPDLDKFNGLCPVFEALGYCRVGWKCRFVKSHSREQDLDDGRKELLLVEDPAKKAAAQEEVNHTSTQLKQDLQKRRYNFEDAEKAAKYLDMISTEGQDASRESAEANGGSQNAHDNRATYIEPPFKPSEKRRVYFGPETPVLAPLTTQGNLPYRRLCVELGAQLTYSEMAMSIPLVQGHKPEWALLKAHSSEAHPPSFSSKGQVVQGYDNSKDVKFGTQISANKHWQAIKAAQVLSAVCPVLRVIDLNCGCPIDLVCRTGAGSALLDSPSKLEKIVRGINLVSGEIPVTVKIRMGTKDNRPTAQTLLRRLAFGTNNAASEALGPCGAAAVTLHGRSKAQRYSRSANWEYIAECAALIKQHGKDADAAADTIAEPDARDLPAAGKMYFLGNGDCYSHVDYYDHIEKADVDSVMIARGALIKPWIFEEIEKGQYLDKSGSERLAYVEKFVRYGLEHWGADEMGIGQTRRFLLESLSFTSRYVPIGILEHLPPSMQDRAPAWNPRSDLEGLLSSPNASDWIKISEMFLGKAPASFKFTPKHKSKSTELEAEG